MLKDCPEETALWVSCHLGIWYFSKR